MKISRDIIPQLISVPKEFEREYDRTTCLMDAGDSAREKSRDNSILALGASALMASRRSIEGQPLPRHAFIINSLKHPEEVTRLRDIYPGGFYLIGIHSDETRRREFLMDVKRTTEADANRLMQRDQDENLPHGQKLAETFHMSDFFVRIDDSRDHLKNSISRFIDILLGHPYKTPTFDEYAMFLAFAASLRSADLSRQVGAVVARNNEILSTGANECPQFGGGLYWPTFDHGTRIIVDAKGGRDYTRKKDSNKAEQEKIINGIVEEVGSIAADPDKLRQALLNSAIRDLTEYGRVVHAEMEALMCCARSHGTTRGGVLYCTTFPCHNCAKHIVAAGIERVVFIEPYAKSKALQLHEDSISLGFVAKRDTVRFEPFIGVGPRRFFDLFSMKLSSGYPLKRNDGAGNVISWELEKAKLRMQMRPCSYLDLELLASAMFDEHKEKMESPNEDQG